MATSASPSADSTRAKPRFLYRPSENRGGGDHGWLKTLHTFSFADYHDPAFMNFGALRVINEDRVDPGEGFPTHRHAEAEIWSYILSGELSHKDSMGNVETMKKGDVQMTSGGTGIRHSEYNDHASEPVHFLQIWALPSQRGLKPQYYTRHVTEDDKRDKIVAVVAPVGSEGVVDEREGELPTPVHSTVHFFTTLISPSTSLTHTIHPRTSSSPSGNGNDGKLFYAQVVQSSGFNTGPAIKDGSRARIRIASVGGGGGQGNGEVTLGEGDGVFVTGLKSGDELRVENTGEKRGEVVLFEMDA